MPRSSHGQVDRLAAIERLRIVRNWCAGVGVALLLLALMLLSNTVGNPKTWSSAFHALAASGAFVVYGSWLAIAGGLVLAVALLVAFYVSRVDR